MAQYITLVIARGERFPVVFEAKNQESADRMAEEVKKRFPSAREGKALRLNDPDASETTDKA